MASPDHDVGAKSWGPMQRTVCAAACSNGGGGGGGGGGNQPGNGANQRGETTVAAAAAAAAAATTAAASNGKWDSGREQQLGRATTIGGGERDTTELTGRQAATWEKMGGRDDGHATWALRKRKQNGWVVRLAPCRRVSPCRLGFLYRQDAGEVVTYDGLFTLCRIHSLQSAAGEAMGNSPCPQQLWEVCPSGVWLKLLG